jgi:hypothetical protein
MNKDYSKLIKKNKYQIFIFTCPANAPFHFARHPWIVTNEKGKITRYEGRHIKNKKNNSHIYQNLFPTFQGIEMFIFSKKWYWKGELFYNAEGLLAKKMISVVKSGEKNYPYLHTYSFLGPNSNTYVQWVLDQFPSIKKELPWNAIGKKHHRKKIKDLSK